MNSDVVPDPVDGLAERGAGLTNMSDRLGAVGGRLTIESKPGEGTRVRGAVPLAEIGGAKMARPF